MKETLERVLCSSIYSPLMCKEDTSCWPISNVRATRGKMAILLELHFLLSLVFRRGGWSLSSLLNRQTFRHIETNGSVGVNVAVDQRRKRSEILLRHCVHPGGISQK